GLHLGGIDVHPTGDDQVGAAVGEVQVAVGVEIPHITEGEVVTPVARRGLVRVSEVREAAGIRRLDVDGADLTGGQLPPGGRVEDADVVRCGGLADRARALP